MISMHFPPSISFISLILYSIVHSLVRTSMNNFINHNAITKTLKINYETMQLIETHVKFKSQGQMT